MYKWIFKLWNTVWTLSLISSLSRNLFQLTMPGIYRVLKELLEHEHMIHIPLFNQCVPFFLIEFQMSIDYKNNLPCVIQSETNTTTFTYSFISRNVINLIPWPKTSVIDCYQCLNLHQTWIQNYFVKLY